MRYLLTLLAAAICTATASAHTSRPAKKPEHLREVTTRYSAKQLAAWSQHQVDGQACSVSPVLDFGRGAEVNHHRVTVAWSGKGSVALSLAHSAGASLKTAIAKSYLHSRFRTARSGREITITSPYKSERYVWLILRTVGAVKFSGVRHTCLRGQGTLYGHAARTFEFRGAKLPYRLMYPRNYNPKRSYPLVLSVSGSGGVGSGNVRNMEMVILARYLFTNYYYDKQFECFSIVPQIPPHQAIPPPYWPRGESGKPTPLYHPGWPAVNENGWYTQAALALIQNLISDKAFKIDPDRVYYSGFSYGGKACWEFLKAGRGLFAAAMCGAGWPIGPAGSNPAGLLAERLKLEVQRYKHVPVHIFAGERDRMRFGSRAVHKEILAQGGKSTYTEFPKTTHVGSAGVGWSNRKYIAWLFQQNRKNNPKPGKDPFPGGAYLEKK